MSNTESFVEEVTDELRNDQLWAAIRKYGWIAAVAVVLIVAGAAFNEYRKGKVEKAAREKGDQIMTALASEDAAQTIAALEGAADAGITAKFLLADQQLRADDKAAAIETYTQIATSADAGKIYQDLAVFKSLMLQGTDTDVAERKAAFEMLAQPGGTYRLLAEEQLALIDVEMGDTDAALARLQQLLADTEVTQGLRRRATQAIVALGGSLSQDG